MMEQALSHLRSLDLDQTLAVPRSRLPLVDRQPTRRPVAGQRSVADRSVSSTSAPSAPAPRVLVAEDTPSIAFLVQRFLEQMGCDVRVVANGHAAVEQVKTACRSGQPYDLVIMDLQMPIMSGFDATATIRSFEVAPPILAMTAGSADWVVCRQHGFTGLITKPINRQAFGEAVWSNLQAA